MDVLDSCRSFRSCSRIAVIVVASLAFPFNTSASEIAHFAGFAYTGAYQDITKSFPYTYAINVTLPDGTNALDKALLDHLKGSSFPGFGIDYQGLGNTKTGDTLALALGLNRETVSVEHLAGVYKILITLDAQAMFFDMKSMQMVASYPFGVEYIDTTSSEPADMYIHDLISKLYLGGLSVNIFDEFSNTLSKIDLKQHYGHTIQVTSVVIDDRAKAQLPSSLQESLPTMQALVASEFSQYLSKNANVPVLPYMKDYAIGNKIAARFANGDVFNLTVPDPDYSISIDLLNFKKIKYDETSAGASWIYAAFIQLHATEPLSNHVYLDAMVKQAATKTVPASQTNVDDWAAYQDTLQSLMNELTRSIMNPDPTWVKSHTDNPNHYLELQELKKVVVSCQ